MMVECSLLLLDIGDLDAAEPPTVRRLAATFGIEDGVVEEGEDRALLLADFDHFHLELPQEGLALEGVDLVHDSNPATSSRSDPTSTSSHPATSPFAPATGSSSRTVFGSGPERDSESRSIRHSASG